MTLEPHALDVMIGPLHGSAQGPLGIGALLPIIFLLNCTLGETLNVGDNLEAASGA